MGVEMRATMDIDTTVKALPLTETDAEKIISEIKSLRCVERYHQKNLDGEQNVCY